MSGQSLDRRVALESSRACGFNCLLMEAEPDYAAFLKARFRRDDPPGLAGDIFG
jgi:hypothetical protein